MTNPLNILFQSADGIGHMNACIGVAQILRDSGHRIVFTVNEQWRGKLSVYGFEEELYIELIKDSNQDQTKNWSEQVKMLETLIGSSQENIYNNVFSLRLEKARNIDASLNDIVNRVKPDVIVIDDTFVCPSLIKTGIPWVCLCSANPLFILPANENLPPSYFGNELIIH